MKLIKLKNLRGKKYKKGVKSFRWQHPFVIPVAVFFLLFFVGIVGFISMGGETVGAADTKVVKLTIDGEQKTIPTRARRVEDLLNNLGIKLQKEDAVDPALVTPIAGKDFKINIIRAQPYVIVDEDGSKTYVTMAGIDEKDVVNRAGVEIYFEDEVLPEPTFASETARDGFVGTKLLINRATPVLLSLYGKTVLARTHASTVGGLLEEKGITLNDGDTLHPKADKKITKNMRIFILAKGKKIAIKEEDITPPVQEREDPEAELGTEEVIEEGRPGRKVVTYEILIKGGREIGRKELHSIVVEQPKKRIVIVGTKTAGFDGDFGAALARLRSCEGSYTSNTGNGYYGAYQFAQGSWDAYAPNRYKGVRPSDTPPGVQDLTASNYYRAAGWAPWPACSRKLGLQDIYR